MKKHVFYILFPLCWVHPALAQLPHESILLINRSSEASAKVANVFAAARGVPARNIVHLELPEHVNGEEIGISPVDFTEHIWEPAWQQIRERGFKEDEVLAWIYSVDFPTRVHTAPPTSLTGLTLVRNQMPEKNQVSTGKAVSPLFGGASGLGGPPPRSPYSLDAFVANLSTNMPLPSMMLGFLGKEGSTVDEVLACIQRGIQSDATRPKEGIYFSITTDKARSGPREWQYAPVTEELARIGIAARTVTNLPAGAKNVIGLLTGKPVVNPGRIASYAPGAMTEHLTSSAGNFRAGQTKLTAWINAGATASCGTVVEPRNYWMKFPHARFYVYYASGCTMLESFYQAIASPLQQIIIGEPFARPWRLPLNVRVRELPPQPPSTTPRFQAVMQPRIDKVEYSYRFLLDGHAVGPTDGSDTLALDTSSLSDGYHELTVVGRAGLSVGHRAVWRQGFSANTLGRGITIGGPEELGDQEIALSPEFVGEEKPRSMRLIHQGRTLDETSLRFRSNPRLTFHEQDLGEGPHTVRVVAEYKDGMQVSSHPVPFSIVYTEPEVAE